MKKKFNRLDYIIEKKNGETIIKMPGQIEGRAFAIRYLENCKVYLYDHSAQVGLLPSFFSVFFRFLIDLCDFDWNFR